MKYFDKLPDNAIQVEDALNWVTPDGSIYGIETRILKYDDGGNPIRHGFYGKYFKYKTTINNHNGYVYCPVKQVVSENETKIIHKRLHILIAKAFIANPNNYFIVGHKNNIKSDNRVENLYWTTISENTKKAYDDGLAKNDSGFDDSQSKPVMMYSTYTNELLGTYGSGREASKETGIPLNTISRQCKYKRPVRKEYYFRYVDDKSNVVPPVVAQYDYYTDKEIKQFWNCEEASRKTGINSKTIGQQCNNNFKPKRVTKSKTYFLYKQQ